MTCEHGGHAGHQQAREPGRVRDVTGALNPGSESAVTVASDASLEAEAVAAALDEAGGYQFAG